MRRLKRTCKSRSLTLPEHWIQRGECNMGIRKVFQNKLFDWIIRYGLIGREHLFENLRNSSSCEVMTDDESSTESPVW